MITTRFHTREENELLELAMRRKVKFPTLSCCRGSA